MGITPDREDATAEDPKTAYFSVLDLSKAFYTLPIHPESKWLTCFIVPQIGSFLWRGMPMGLASSPSNFVEATARRLRPWQILYEPGNEQPLEGKYNNPLTAEFCSPNGPTRDPKSSGDGCETHKDSISSLRKVTTFPSQTHNEGGSIELDRRTQSSDLANSVTGASAPTGSAAGRQQPARSRQQPAASRPPAGQSELGAALDPRPTCTSTAGACESADSQFSDKSENLGNIRGRNEETPNEYMRSRAPPTHFMDIYIDDCVIVTASYATHVRALKRFLEACRAERMYVNQKAILGCIKQNSDGEPSHE